MGVSCSAQATTAKTTTKTTAGTTAKTTAGTTAKTTTKAATTTTPQNLDRKFCCMYYLVIVNNSYSFANTNTKKKDFN